MPKELAHPPELTPYQQRALAQAKQWISGESVHNTIDDECCPDFSCCEPNLFTRNRLSRIDHFNKWAAKVGAPLHHDD